MNTLLANLTDSLGISAERRAIRAYLRTTPPPVSPEVRVPIGVTERIGFETWDFQVGYRFVA